MNKKPIMYIINKDYQILYKNGEFTRRYPDITCGQTCYTALGHQNAICVHCPVLREERSNTFYNTDTGEWIKAQTAEMEWNGDTDCHVLVCKIWHENLDNLPEGFSKEEHDEIEELMVANAQMSRDMRRIQTDLKQKHQSLERKSLAIIQALCSDYSNVYCIDLEHDRFEVFRMDEFVTEWMKDIMESTEKCYSDCISTYIRRTVYEPDQRTMLEVFQPDKVRESLKDKASFVHNYRIFRGGGIRYYQVRCVRFEDEDGISKIIMGFRNVDEEVHREQEQKQILADALAQAEYASRAKTTFLNNMSHDIRTPMNAIIGYTALATAHINKKDRVLDYLSKIAQSSEHLLSLINDVLDMSRIESGKMHIEEKPENLAELMQSMRNMIQNDIRSKQLELYVDTMDVVDEDIYCDKLRLNQMLLNLISNAIKFTKPGGMISIRIRQLPETQKHYGTYEFRVKDTGIGMSREFADHIFEPFTRESSSTVSGIQGTGLGMSITKNIVDMMDGAIEVHTEQGKGSEFLVTLKFRLQSEHKPVESIKELEGMRSLVVDDDIDTCQGVAKMLRQIGLRAEWTMYGKEAVVRTREAIDMDDRYHVYIIDWMMPDMNGIETARQIRKIVGDDAPIIVLSAYDWTDIEEEARAAGVTDFVSKPAFVSDIRRVLLKNCRGEHVEVPETRPTMENRFKDKRVLLVEDNELNREIATEILEMTGVSVEEAENGKEAVDVFGRSSEGYYDLILMDVQMPVMDGYEATSVIRSMSRKDAGNIPILAMTANAFAEDVENARLSGMNEHLAKPLAPKNLVKAMETWLESRG